jgi:hypothetical protein
MKQKDIRKGLGRAAVVRSNVIIVFALSVSEWKEGMERKLIWQGHASKTS